MKSFRRFSCFLLAALLLGATGPVAVAGEGMAGAGDRWMERPLRREDMGGEGRQSTMPPRPSYPDARPPAVAPERRSWEEGRDEDREARREARRQWLNSRRLDEGRGAMAPGGSEDSWRHRLSPEERQRLRQDINEAGREVYPRESLRDGRPVGPGAFPPPRHP